MPLNSCIYIYTNIIQNYNLLFFEKQILQRQNSKEREAFDPLTYSPNGLGGYILFICHVLFALSHSLE